MSIQGFQPKLSAKLSIKNATFEIVEKGGQFILKPPHYIYAEVPENEDLTMKMANLVHNDIVELSPAYDLLNSTIITQSSEEIALPIRGKKSRLKREDFIDYYAQERLQLSEMIILEEFERFKKVQTSWEMLIENSFLSSEKKLRYLTLLHQRRQRLSL